MKVKYDPESDLLIFIIKDIAPSNAISEAGGIIISYDETGETISLEFLNASKRKLVNTQ